VRAIKGRPAGLAGGDGKEEAQFSTWLGWVRGAEYARAGEEADAFSTGGGGRGRGQAQSGGALSGLRVVSDAFFAKDGRGSAVRSALTVVAGAFGGGVFPSDGISAGAGTMFAGHVGRGGRARFKRRLNGCLVVNERDRCCLVVWAGVGGLASGATASVAAVATVAQGCRRQDSGTFEHVVDPSRDFQAKMHDRPRACCDLGGQGGG